MAEAMTLNTAKHDQAAWADMRRLFTDAEIVEISLITAMFNMINRLNNHLERNSNQKSTTAGSTERSG